jgi:hypothetical protein
MYTWTPNSRDETTLFHMPDGDHEMKELSKSAIRMRRLRERRRNGWTRVIAIDVSATDAVALRGAGFLRQGESAVDALSIALKRLVASIR